MFTFFSKGYTALRNDKIKLYKGIGVYNHNTKEHLPHHWPICNFPHFHSITEFIMQFAGIFLKPLLCFGNMIYSLMKASYHLIDAIISLVFLWRTDLSINALGESLYEASNIFYMLMSTIADPILAFVSFAMRSMISVLYGLSLLFYDNSSYEPTTPKLGSFEYVKTVEETPVDENSPSFQRNTSSLNTIPLSNAALEEWDDWHNAPMI